MSTRTAPGRARSPTRALILNEAERLIALKGVFGFTLNDVAAPLGVQVPAIYKHFKGRDDVLIEVSRRFIDTLSRQFQRSTGPAQTPADALRHSLDEFVNFHLAHPAYVRLSLVDFATPEGGMEYVKLAAGGSFEENFRSGPLAAMHARLDKLIRAGVRSKDFRPVGSLNFYRVVKSFLLIQLVFPDDTLLAAKPTARQRACLQATLWDLASRYLANYAGAVTSDTCGRARVSHTAQRKHP
jgi:AcrR family transcriptional regulator